MKFIKNWHTAFLAASAILVFSRCSEEAEAPAISLTTDSEWHAGENLIRKDFEDRLNMSLSIIDEDDYIKITSEAESGAGTSYTFTICNDTKLQK